MASVGSPTAPGSGNPGHINDHSIIKAFLDQHGTDDPVHVASGVSFSPTGLIVVSGANVQSALASVDAALAAGPNGYAVNGDVAGTLPTLSLGNQVVKAQHYDPTSLIPEAQLNLASDALPTTPSRRVSPYRVGVGSWRVDASARAVTNTVLGAGYLNGLYFTPLWVPTLETWDQIGVYCAAIGAGTVNFRAGLWADTGDGKPGTLIYDGGVKSPGAVGTLAWTIATDHVTAWQTVAGLTNAANPGQVAPGLYWSGIALQSTPTTYPTVTIISGLASAFVGGNGGPFPTNGWIQPGVSGAFGAAAPTTPPGPPTVIITGARVASRP